MIIIMNIKQLKNNLDNVKRITPEVYKETMELSLPLFMLHKKLYENGEVLIHKKYSLTQSELDILCTLYYSTGDAFSMSPTELYEVMLFSSGGMTKVLKKLESKSLIVRVDNTLDKRSKIVKITELGKELTSKAIKEIVGFEDTYFSKLNEKEQYEFQRLLYKVLD